MLRWSRAVTLTVLCSATSVLDAQGIGKIGAADIKSAAQQTTVNDSKGVAFRMSADGNAQYILNRRTTPSAVEMHCAWDDLVVVQSGVGILQSSRKFKGRTKYAQWEWRASSLVEPSKVSLAAGDIVRVPAGDGHQISRLGDAPLVYLVVKLRTADTQSCASLPARGR